MEYVIGGCLNEKYFTGEKFNFDNAKSFAEPKSGVCNFVTERETTWRAKCPPPRVYVRIGVQGFQQKRECKPLSCTHVYIHMHIYLYGTDAGIHFKGRESTNISI